MIIDLNNAGITNFPKNAVMEIIKIHQLNFKNHLHKLFFYNPSWTFWAIWKVISKLYNQKYIGRVRTVKKGREKDFMEIMDAKWWEKKYGGEQEDVPEGGFWPPPKVYPNPMTNEDLVEKKLMAFNIIGNEADVEIFPNCKVIEGFKNDPEGWKNEKAHTDSLY